MSCGRMASKPTQLGIRSRPHGRSTSSRGRLQARKRLEDQRQAALRTTVPECLADSGGLADQLAAIALSPSAGQAGVFGDDGEEDEPIPLGDALCEVEHAGRDTEKLSAAVENVLYSLDAIPAFQCRGSAVGRFLTDHYASALNEVCSCVRRVAETALFDEVIDAVTQRFANTSASRYEQSAAASWPTYSRRCPDLTARFQLSPSGLVTYTLGPRASTWALTGEGCWRALPCGRPTTEIILEMRHGLRGTALSPDGNIRDAEEAPCALHVDIRQCTRVMLDGSSGENEDDLDEDGDDDGSAL